MSEASSGSMSNQALDNDDNDREEQHRGKRPRPTGPQGETIPDNVVQQNDGVVTTFCSLPGDSIRLILKYLTAEELHRCFALVSKRCYAESQSDPSLPQTRTGEIVCTPPNCNLTQLVAKLRQSNAAFQHPRSKLKLTGQRYVNPARVKKKMAFEQAPGAQAPTDRRLHGVTSLDLSVPKLDGHDPPILPLCVPKLMSLLLPNLVEVNLSYNDTGDHTASALRNFKSCVNLRAIHWHGARRFPLFASCLGELTSLKELYIDNVIMKWPGEELPSDIEQFVLCESNFSALERVSIKNARCQVRSQPHTYARAVPQDLIAEFVRRSRSLRWFSSDLSQQHVTTLQAEKPLVAFES